jgi:predicted transcriptional regulator
MRQPRRDKQFWVRLSTAEKSALQELALQQDVTASWLVRHTIKTLVAQRKETVAK